MGGGGRSRIFGIGIGEVGAGSQEIGLVEWSGAKLPQFFSLLGKPPKGLVPYLILPHYGSFPSRSLQFDWGADFCHGHSKPLCDSSNRLPLPPSEGLISYRCRVGLQKEGIGLGRG